MSYGILGQVFGLVSSFLINKRLQVVLDGRSSKNIELMLEFLKALFLVLQFSYYILMTFLMSSVILLSMLMILLSTHEPTGIWSVQQLDIAAEPESDLKETVDWGRDVCFTA